MTYEQGELYFVRELERTGQKSAFVKIGLVRYADKRDSFNRLAEHQTGNPRKLQLNPKEIVKTPAVDMVEAQMHRVYASKRVSGEWFEFEGESEIASAVAKARDLAAEAESFVPLFEQAAKQRLVDSVLGQREPTEAEADLGRRNAIAKLKINLCEKAKGRVAKLLIASVQAGEDVSDVAKFSVTTFAPAFLEDEFKVAHPDLYAQYLVQNTQRQATFLNKMKVVAADLDAEFVAAWDELEAIIASVDDHSKVGNLNTATLIITHLKGLASWEQEITAAQLKIAMEDYELINGVCGWNRYDAVRTKFDSGRFAEENPELAIEFTSKPVVKETLKVKKTKA